MDVSIGLSVEDVMFMIIAYMVGMIATSFIIKRDGYKKRQDYYYPYDAYEHVIADLMARMDVIDLRMRRIDDITAGLLYSKGSYAKKEEGGGGSSKAVLINDIKDENKSSASMANASSVMEDNMNKGDDNNDDTREGEGMNHGLMIISSYRNTAVNVMKEKEGGEGMRWRKVTHTNDRNSTIERVLSMLQEGPKTSREIEKRLGMSREHTARLMKRLYGMGYVMRDESKRPYRYMLAQGTSSTS
ncbi:MAG: winged helix-turn-helix domain-containing protein [Candidatus Nitrosocaldus sp.]